MEKDKLDLILENEKEWRQYMIEKLDRIDSELSTFKMRVIGLASFFGGITGMSAEYIKQLLTGGN